VWSHPSLGWSRIVPLPLLGFHMPMQWPISRSLYDHDAPHHSGRNPSSRLPREDLLVGISYYRIPTHLTA
jgi:hypothetical protein